MIASDKKLLFSIFFLVLGLSERVADCCLADFSDGSTDELDALQTMFNRFSRSSKYPTGFFAGSILGSSANEILKLAQFVSDRIVNELGAYYVIKFLRGYLHYNNKNSEHYDPVLAVDCSNTADLLIRGIVPPIETSGKIVETDPDEFVEKIANESSSSNIYADVSLVTKEYYALREKLRKLDKRWTDQQLNVFLNDTELNHFCSFFGLMLYGDRKGIPVTNYKKRDEERDESLWKKAPTFFGKYGTLKDNRLLPAILRDIEILNAASVSGFLEDEIPVVIVKQKENFTNAKEVRFAKFKQNEIYLLTKSSQSLPKDSFSLVF